MPRYVPFVAVFLWACGQAQPEGPAAVGPGGDASAATDGTEVSPAADAASGTSEDGAVMPDAGSPSPDAGFSPRDGGTRVPDAGSSPPDASTAVGMDGAAGPVTIAPFVVPATGGTGAHLVTAGSSNRLELHGVTVWGITDFVTSTFGTAQHDARDAVAATIANWKGNVIRLRVLADEYENPTKIGSKTAYLQWIEDWVATAKANHLYVQLCWWDSLDSQNAKNDANWATQYAYAFPMMKDVHDGLKLADGSEDPAVFYEPFNEPNGIDWAEWTTAMQATLTHFRSDIGYQGLLVLDTTTWSHDYSDGPMSQMETFDATLTRSGKANLAFAHHDYTDDYANVWSGDKWAANTGGTSTAHVIYETEFGNWNGAGNQSDTWSAAVTAYFKTDLFDRSNVAGADAFLFGNWFDANAMSSDPQGAQPTTWGSDVKGWLSAY